MMQGSLFQCRVETISPVEKSLHFEIPTSYVKERLESAYRKAAKDAEIPGFRKGKAPRSMLERYYKKRIEADLFLDLFQESLDECVEKEQLHLVSQPVLEYRSDIASERPLEYRVRIETYPTVEIKNYEGLSVKERSPSVKEEDIDNELERRRERMMELKPIEDRQTLSSSDVVSLEVKDPTTGKPYYEKPLMLDLGKPKESPLPGLVEALIGQPKDLKEHAVSLTMPPQATKDSAESHPLKLQITVSAAYLKQLPSLDDEFAKDTGEASSLSELREKVRESLLRADTSRVKRELEDQLVDELIKQNPVSLPPSLVRKVAQDYLQERRYEVFAEVLKKRPSTDQIAPQLLLEAAESLASRDLSFQLLVRPIAEKEAMEVTQADIEKRLAEWANQRGSQPSRIKSEIEREDPQLRNLRAQLLIEKVIDLLKSRAQIEDVATGQ